MRLLLRISDEASARGLSDLLTVRDIPNHVVPDDDGWTLLWVDEDDQLDDAKRLLADASVQALDPVAVSDLAKTQQAERRRQDAIVAERLIDVRKDWHRQTGVTLGIFTSILIGLSVAITGIYSFGLAPEMVRQVFISQYLDPRQLLPLEVSRGEIWRVITPIFLHFGLTHILFNMMWLKDLGSLIEHHKGTWFFALLVLAIAAVSNLGQYVMSGPRFGGMSGVVYGLFGYIWMKSRFDPLSGFRLEKNTVVLMIVWLVVCMTGLVGPVANTAHTLGLGTGAVWGFVEAKFNQSRMRSA